MKISGVMIGASDVDTLATFYTAVLGEPSFRDGEWYGWGQEAFLMLGPHSEVKGKSAEPQRLMIMLDDDDVKGTFEKFKSLGAEVIAEPYRPQDDQEGFWLATLADPEGNYFQLASPM